MALFDLSVFGSGTPATLRLDLLTEAATEKSGANDGAPVVGNGYQSLEIANTGAVWDSISPVHIQFTPDVQFSIPTGPWGTIRGFRLRAAVPGPLAAFGPLKPVEIGTNDRVEFLENAINIFPDHATATLHVTQLYADQWSGRTGAIANAEWGVCDICGRTVPVWDLGYNRRFGWQCLGRSGYGTPRGCWDGPIQRDEIYYVPRPYEGVRRSPAPTGVETEET